MLRFDPPELRGKIAEAIENWTASVSPPWEGFSDEIVDVSDPNFDPADYPDETITEATLFTLSLPRWEEEVWLTYGEFIELARELRSAYLRDNRECWTDSRLLVRVSPVDEAAWQTLDRLLPELNSEEERREYLTSIEHRKRVAALRERVPAPDKVGGDEPFDEQAVQEYLEASRRERELADKLNKATKRYCSIETRIDGREVLCCLTFGFTIFGILVAARGDYDKYLPPVLDDDLFVEIRFGDGLTEEAARNLLEAYRFELSSSLSVDLEVHPRPALVDEGWSHTEEADLSWFEPRLRPLLLGKGMAEVLDLYNRAVSTFNREIQILYFTKVVEFVSRTVISLRSTEAIRTKLLSPRSLQPDAQYIAELQTLVEEQRNYRKDREAIKLAVITCCEMGELAQSAPPFLAKLQQAAAANRREKEEALAEFSSSLYATRNAVAHAKANYESTGEECPDDQLSQFAECAKLAAQQAVRWYYSRPEDVRLA